MVSDRWSTVTLGLAERQGDLLDDVRRFCNGALGVRSVYAFLHRERDRLFPDEMFADLFSDRGRRSVPPSVVATVMVLQRLEGLSDREAVERYTFDARWRYAAGVGGYDRGGWGSFAHTVLVDMRERLRRSARPDRIFQVALEAAKAAGLVGRRRVLDSTPLYDAVTTMDTVTLVRSAIRSLFKSADGALEAELRAGCSSGDDYGSSAKPQIDWDDPDARDALIDSRARDALAVLAVLDGRDLDQEVVEAAALLARVVGQDLEAGNDGVFRIARKVAADRVISTVDPDARHGHKTSARGFDGYKGHAAIDPDSEIITSTAVTPSNAGDAGVAEELITDLVDAIDSDPNGAVEDPDGSPGEGAATQTGASPKTGPGGGKRRRPGRTQANKPAARARRAESRRTSRKAKLARRRTGGEGKDRPVVYGDNAYGTGPFQSRLEDAGIDSRCKTQRPTATGGLFAKDRFSVDLDAGSVTCPAEVTVEIRPHKDGAGMAYFGEACTHCPLRAQCTNASGGRTIAINPHEDVLARARVRQTDPAWSADYRATRPKVERKLAHLMRRKHGGRRARVRGKTKVAADFNLLAAAANLARLAVVGLHGGTEGGWAIA